MKGIRLLCLVSILVPLLLAGCEQPNSLPVARFVATPSSGQAPLFVSLDASSSSDRDGYIVAYTWAFGDGVSGTGVTASHTYAAGNYEATLTVRDDAGGTDSVTQTVSIAASSTPAPTPPSPTAKLQLLDFSLQPYDNMFMPLIIIGHAKNVTTKKLSYAEVHGQFYDAGNVLLASWLDNTSDLPAGVTWEFQIHLMDADVVDRVDHVTVTVGSCF
jgi:PKD repeat protein